MEKMHGVTLKIITENGGEASLFQSEAVYEKTSDGERIRYRIENDEGELFFADSFLEMRRRGECGMSVRFCEGKESEMTLSSSGLEGKLSVDTTRYKVKRGRAGSETELCYRLGRDAVQTFSLKIQVLFFSEEK